MTDLTALPRWPRVEARTHADGSGELTINGTSHPIPTTDAGAARAEMTRRVADLAAKLGRPIRVATHGPDGSWSIVVHPDGTVEADPDTPPSPSPARPTTRAPRGRRPGRRRTGSASASASAGQRSAPPAPDEPQPEALAAPPAAHSAVTALRTARTPQEAAELAPYAPVAVEPAEPEPTEQILIAPVPTNAAPIAPDVSAAAEPPSWPSWLSARPLPAPDTAPARPEPPAALPTVGDLLRSRPEPAPGPAEQGWRSQVRRLSLGLVRPGPGLAESSHRAAAAEVRRSLTGPKTVVVINPKGGAHKTTATLLLAAAFGRERGGYTLAWDNNETRGTLGWRAQSTAHTRTATDLLADLDRFSTATRGRVGDLDHYVRPQRGDHFDVLASDEDAAAAATIDDVAFDRLHATLTRFYRILIVDTGNNMRAPNWGAAVDAADQLVIVSTIREDTAATAAWLVDGLRARGHKQKVAQAVTLLAAPDARAAEPSLRARLHDHFGQLTRTVVDVPYDRALAAGAPIDVDQLQNRTREAWLQATAAVASGM